MGSYVEGRLRVINGLLSLPPISAVLFQHVRLDEVGSKPCSLLLKQAIRHAKNGHWDCCREAALKARELAWEQLHR